MLSSNVPEISTKETTHTICYICNKFVPKDYVFEHLNSSKHIAYQKITETAIERARKHKHLTGEDQIKSRSEYFCEHCVATVYSCNRYEHENSIKHKNLAALDAFLNNFALFYTNDLAEDIIEAPVFRNLDDLNLDISILKVTGNPSQNNKDEHEVGFEVMPLKVNDDKECNKAKLNNECSSLEIKVKESVALISDIQSCLEAPHKEINNNYNEVDAKKAEIASNLEQYIKHLKKYGTAKLNTIDSLDQHRIRIETLNGVEIVASTFNFHGFKKMGKYIQCRLCDMFVKDANDHRLSEKHMKVVSQPFEDKHSIRPLKNNKSHCVVCNEIVDSVMVHTHFNNHLRKVEQALIPKANTPKEDLKENVHVDDVLNTKTTIELSTTSIKESVHYSSVNENTLQDGFATDKTKTINVNEIEKPQNENPIKSISNNQCYCTICETRMHVNNIENHLSGTKHTLKSVSRMYYLMRKVTNDMLSCKVCDIRVLTYSWAVKDHIESIEHVNNYNNFLESHKIDITKNGFFCQACGKALASMSEILHTEQMNHQIKLASYNIISIDIKVNDIKHGHYVDTDITSSKRIPDEGTNNESLIIGNTEEENANIPLNEENILANLNNKDTKTNIGNTSTSNVDFASNEVKEDGEENLQHKTLDVLLTRVNSLLGQLSKYFNNPPEIHSHFQRTDGENVLRCKVCTEKVAIEDIEKHTNSLKHIHNHRDLMLVNKLKLKNYIYVCYACNVYVDSCKELRHIETVEHEKRIESLKNGDYVLVSADNKKLIDKVQSELKVMEANNNVLELREMKFGDFITRNNVLVTEEDANIRHHFCSVVDNEKKVICVLCQELVENTKIDTRTHVSFYKHEENYDTIMAYNQIFEIEEGFVCGYCECIIKENELKHVANEKHIANQNKYPRKNFCFTCKESMIDLGPEEHLISARHIKRVSTPAHFYCNTCNVQIKNNEDDIQRHSECFEHKNNCLLFDENKIVLRNKKCVCQICNEGFIRDDFDDHIRSLSHVRLLMAITH